MLNDTGMKINMWWLVVFVAIIVSNAYGAVDLFTREGITSRSNSQALECAQTKKSEIYEVSGCEVVELSAHTLLEDLIVVPLNPQYVHPPQQQGGGNNNNNNNGRRRRLSSNNNSGEPMRLVFNQATMENVNIKTLRKEQIKSKIDASIDPSTDDYTTLGYEMVNSTMRHAIFVVSSNGVTGTVPIEENGVGLGFIYLRPCKQAKREANCHVINYVDSGKIALFDVGNDTLDVITDILANNYTMHNVTAGEIITASGEDEIDNYYSGEDSKNDPNCSRGRLSANGEEYCCPSTCSTCRTDCRANSNDECCGPAMDVSKTCDKALAPCYMMVTQTVTVAYTNSVQDALGKNLNDFIRLAVAETNQGYISSNIPIRLQLKATYLSTVAESVDSLKILTDFRGSPRFGANMAVLISTSLSSCGRGYLDCSRPGAPDSMYCAYAVVKHVCAVGHYSFGHELGHIQGADHNIEVYTPPSRFNDNHGYVINVGYQNEGGIRTIMAYTILDEDRINIWSSPKLSVNGFVAGVINSSNNKRVLTTTRYAVASFNSGDEIPDTPPPTDAPVVPTRRPTLEPTPLPPTTPRPTNPTASPSWPTRAPTTPAPTFPTSSPTRKPTTPAPTLALATGSPSTQTPTTGAPTRKPTLRPTNPTASPSSNSPTKDPTRKPTSRSPTNLPTSLSPSSRSPTRAPSQLPTSASPSSLSPNSASPSSRAPTATLFPTSAFPTRSPTTLSPSLSPSTFPTRDPSRFPTRRPTASPTTKIPSMNPTKQPSKNPTKQPTVVPSHSPTTKIPSMNPTKQPSKNPTKQPTTTPTRSPTTRSPSRNPSLFPSKNPTKPPSKQPSASPTLRPTTKAPTFRPSQNPSTSRPTRSPTTRVPTHFPSTTPSSSPTQPSATPSHTPSRAPTGTPTPENTTARTAAAVSVPLLIVGMAFSFAVFFVRRKRQQEELEDVLEKTRSRKTRAGAEQLQVYVASSHPQFDEENQLNPMYEGGGMKRRSQERINAKMADMTPPRKKLERKTSLSMLAGRRIPEEEDIVVIPYSGAYEDEEGPPPAQQASAQYFRQPLPPASSVPQPPKEALRIPSPPPAPPPPLSE